MVDHGGHCAGGAGNPGKQGHPEWVASSFEEYRAIAGSLAKDRRHLTQLYESLSGQVRLSQLFDTQGFARRFESVLQHIWKAPFGF